MSRRIYREGMRQLKTAGIIAAALQMMMAVCMIVMEEASYHETRRSMVIMERPGQVLALSYMLLIPFFTLYLFRFLNSRKACDFYFGLPCKRLVLAGSFLAAVMTWIGMITVGTVAAAGAADLVCSHVYVDWRLVIRACIYVLAGSTKLIGIFFLAVSLTGNALSSFFAAVMLLVIPFLFDRMMEGMRWMYPYLSEYVNVTGSWSVREILLNGPVGGNIMYDAWKEILANAVWAMVTGCIYLAVGLAAFCFRRAEKAQTPALHPLLQTVFRLSAALIPSFAATMVLYQGWMCSAGGQELKEMLSLAGSLLVVAVLTFYLYEIFTAKRLRGVWKITWQLGILAVLNLVLLGGYVAHNWLIRHDIPSAPAISYVQLDFAVEGGYLIDELEEKKIQDERIQQLVSDVLRENIDWYEDQEDKYNDYIWQSGHLCKVTIGKQFGSITRRIAFDEEAFDALLAALDETEYYQEIVNSLPDAYEGRAYVRGLDNQQSEMLYEAYKKDLAQLSFLEIHGSKAGYEELAIMIFEEPEEWIREGTLGCEFVLPVSRTCVNTVEMYIDFCNEAYDEKYEAETAFDRFLAGQENVVCWYLYAEAERSGIEQYSQGLMRAECTDEMAKLLEELSNMLKIQASRPVDVVDGVYLKVLLNGADVAKSVRYYPVNEEMLEILEEARRLVQKELE